MNKDQLSLKNGDPWTQPGANSILTHLTHLVKPQSTHTSPHTPIIATPNHLTLPLAAQALQILEAWCVVLNLAMGHGYELGVA